MCNNQPKSPQNKKGCKGTVILKQITEFFHGNACLANQAAQGAFGKLIVIGYGQAAVRRFTLSQDDMTSRLVVDIVTDSREHTDGFLPRYKRQVTHKVTSTTSS